MSYRELRTITELARALAYPRLISIENFRTPNFALVAEMLEWIVKRFEPSALVSADCVNEQERVIFIKACVTMLLQNARIKLNPKKLYQADGYAVQELLVPMRILHSATRQRPSEELNAQWTAMKATLGARMREVTVARQLSSQLPQVGALLNDLLQKDLYMRRERARATSRTVSVQEAERSLKLTIAAVETERKETEEKIANIDSDERSLDEKIERKRREFDHMQKRYAKLQSYRPAHMDEYERYEEKLKAAYELYVIKFRNLTYLRQLQSELERADQQRAIEAERSMRETVEKLRLEQLNQKDAIEDEMEMLPVFQPPPEAQRAVKVFGNMMGAGLSDEDEDDSDEDHPGASGLAEEEEEEEVERFGAVQLDDDDKQVMSSGDEF
ncbi:dyf-3 [Pristionchus pacificus]|uniref:Dyf-3 n=1 Tax=Pristionchus pacificus TaxID=54126 RepID=A0A2A6C780_PRIPA|nr:dyf-3 [Pristionchus pacificus]|eukprot:PDM73960.1 dyf-3 [Pristionchus pacificus]